MTMENKGLKQKLLDMMRWFHGFCEENHLRYYVLGGVKALCGQTPT